MLKLKTSMKNLAIKGYRLIHKIKFMFSNKTKNNIKLNNSETAANQLNLLHKDSQGITNYNESFKNDISLDLSIIIPVYNVEKYIANCLNSIVSQDIKNYEIICVDDGSKDNSGVICDDFAKKYNHIKVFHEQNKGVSAARNLGIVNARGKYLLFIDSDDALFPNTLSELLKYKTKSNTVQGRYCKVCTNKIYYKSKKYRPYTVNFNLEYGFIWSKIYNRKVFENIKFPIGYWYEDVISDLIILPSLNDIKLIDTYTYKYSFNNTGISQSSKTSYKMLDFIYVLKSIAENIDSFKIDFDYKYFLRLMYQCSTTTFIRLRRFDEEVMKNSFVFLCDVIKNTYKKYNIKTDKFRKIDKQLLSTFLTKNYRVWKNISKFYL